MILLETPKERLWTTAPRAVPSLTTMWVVSQTQVITWYGECLSWRNYHLDPHCSQIKTHEIKRPTQHIHGHPKFSKQIDSLLSNKVGPSIFPAACKHLFTRPRKAVFKLWKTEHYPFAATSTFSYPCAVEAETAASKFDQKEEWAHRYSVSPVTL